MTAGQQTQTLDPREAVEGAVTALAGQWSPAWLNSLRAAALLLPREVAWEQDYGVKDRKFRLREIRLDADRTAGVGKAEDGSFLIRCTRPEDDGSRHEEQMCLSGQAMLALMYLYAQWEDIPWDGDADGAESQRT